MSLTSKLEYLTSIMHAPTLFILYNIMNFFFYILYNITNEINISLSLSVFVIMYLCYILVFAFLVS
jgi:hypothetical protein